MPEVLARPFAHRRQNAGLSLPPVAITGANVQPAIILGFDFGLARIGVAIADTLIRSARPLTTLNGVANTPRFAAIDKLIEEWRPERLIVGLPLSPAGHEHELTRRALRFARQLAARSHLPVALCDERFSSVLAQSGMKITRANKGAVDARAAAIILQAWLDEN